MGFITYDLVDETWLHITELSDYLNTHLAIEVKIGFPADERCAMVLVNITD